MMLLSIDELGRLSTKLTNKHALPPYQGCVKEKLALDNREKKMADEKALSVLFQQMIDGWNQGNGQAFASPFTEDADYVIIDGMHIKGREIIAFGHQHIFDTVYKGTRMEGHLKSIRFLSADIALLHAENVLQIPNQIGIVSEQPATQTIVAIRQTDGWSFTAFQNTRLEKEERP